MRDSVTGEDRALEIFSERLYEFARQSERDLQLRLADEMRGEYEFVRVEWATFEGRRIDIIAGHVDAGLPIVDVIVEVKTRDVIKGVGQLLGYADPQGMFGEAQMVLAAPEALCSDFVRRACSKAGIRLLPLPPDEQTIWRPQSP